MTTSLGATGTRVFPVTLGCMGLSGVYGATSDDASVALIGNAIDRGEIGVSSFFLTPNALRHSLNQWDVYRELSMRG